MHRYMPGALSYTRLKGESNKIIQIEQKIQQQDKSKLAKQIGMCVRTGILAA